MLDARPVGNAIEQSGKIGIAADRFELGVALQLLGQRQMVNRPRRFGKVHHARINPPVRVQQKIFRLQVLRSLVVSQIIEQNGAQNRALGLDIRRKALRGNVISRRHLFVVAVLFQRSC